MSASLAVPLDILRRGILVIVGDLAFLRSTLKRRCYGGSADEIAALVRKGAHADTCAITIEMDDTCDVLVYSPAPFTLPTLVHELCHATQFMLSHLGIEDKETFAFTLEYLVERVLSSAPHGLLDERGKEQTR